MIQISIIIVNYNTKELLQQCLSSIYSTTKFTSFEVIVVDNNSKDESWEMLKLLFPEVNCIQLRQNIGFGRANNIGVENANGEFVFLLNSDTLLTENTIKILYDFFTANEHALSLGVLGCKLVDESGQTMNSGGGFPSIVNDLKEYYYLIAEKMLKMKYEERDSYDFTLPFFEIDYVIGADMFMRKHLYKSVGGFDPTYFMYYEESDMQIRIRKLGYKCFITTKTSIIHLEGGSTSRIKFSQFKRVINQVSRNYYFRKNERKNYKLYVVVDMLLNITRIFNKNYTFKENLDFIIKNIKSY
ncbi:glycosyltransferase family 2 protein [Pedobacter aquae]|uniref:Glycosyltransferase family 2 protein n=1 Tax=Pedobacter aquae TaxID=2605747 RepID=A0A5C0VKQ6_9SPHI|nr:glycosyltransferase family 2 protein [Pedobacter aquae]QEK52211.1 glycosyltransferase family 2 protein [Pedobacter aquae]